MKRGVKAWRWLILVGLLLSGCVPSGGQVPQSPLLSLLGRKSGMIAYTGLDGNVYVVDQGGRNERALTDDANVQRGQGRFLRVYTLPTWGPGRRLAYMGIYNDVTGKTEAWIDATDSEGSERSRVFVSQRSIPFHIYWAPSGEKLGFLAADAAGGPFTLHLASVQEADSLLVDTGQPYFWDWSPNEENLLVHVGGSSQDNPGTARLAFLSTQEPVMEYGLVHEPSAFRAPAYSPSGEHVLYGADLENGEQGLVLAEASGVNASVIAPVVDRVAFGWSPQGRYVAYVSGDDAGEGPVGNLAVMDLSDRANPDQIEIESEQVLAFFWAPDGRQLAYFKLVFAPADSSGEGEERQQLAGLALHIADVSSGDSKLIGEFRPTLAFLEMLTFFDQHQRSSTLWSPDSNYLVLSVILPDGNQSVVVVPASGKFGARPIAQGDLAFWSWD